MKKQNNKTSKKVAAVVAVLALLAGGTYAWTDFTQHKTNEFQGDGRTYDVSLNEDFKEKQDWNLGEDVQKLVNVANKGRLNLDGSVFVRLQFKEFLEYVDGNPILSEHRYMIDTKGNFIKKDSQEELEAYMTENKIPMESIDGVTPRIEKNKGVRDAKESFYIVTQAKDDNGQYGRFLTVGYDDGNGNPAKPTPLVPEEANHSNAAKDQHHEKRNDEDGYTVINWLDKDSVYRKYIELIKNDKDNFILASDWDGKEVQKWIIDDSEGNVENGYMYWGTGLRPEETTTNALESAKLINIVPGQSFYYALHVDMDAISADEIGKQAGWQGISDKLTSMVQNYVEPELIAPSKVGDRFYADGYNWIITAIDEQGRKQIILDDVIRDENGKIVTGLASVAVPKFEDTSVYANSPGIKELDGFFNRLSMIKKFSLNTTPLAYTIQAAGTTTLPTETEPTGKGKMFVPNFYDLQPFFENSTLAMNEGARAKIHSEGFAGINYYSRHLYGKSNKTYRIFEDEDKNIIDRDPDIDANDKTIMIRPMVWIKDDAR